MYTEITEEIIGKLQYHDIYRHVKRVKDKNERMALNTLILKCSRTTLKYQMVYADNCEVYFKIKRNIQLTLQRYFRKSVT